MDFYLAVFDYAYPVLLVRLAADKIPTLGEEVTVDFDLDEMEPIPINKKEWGAESAGTWGEEAFSGSYSFTVTGHSLFVEHWRDLPVVECQLAYNNS